MRKINTREFHRATRSTPREINRKILLNLVRELQPVSRADLARRMHVARGMITQLVDELIDQDVIAEGATANAPRGRKPKLLYVRTRDRYAIAVDVRFSRTHVALTDFDGRQLAMETFETVLNADDLVESIAVRANHLMEGRDPESCEGIGVVVPGMIHRRTGMIVNSPQMGWRDVPLRDSLSRATGLRVLIENAPIASALAHMWLPPFSHDGVDNFAYVTVSDGVGVSVVDDGEVFRGHGDIAGEFGHLPLNLDGPRCMCGMKGCLEAYTSNLATLARYFEVDAAVPATREAMRGYGFGMEDLIVRMRGGDAKAEWAIRETGRYLGIGLGGIITALSPARVIVSGEITQAWDIIREPIAAGVLARSLSPEAAATPIDIALTGDSSRIRGATALLVARRFAAPKVA
ncbi:ROK family protein [Longimicrobium terrae]|uniref:Putative NBD/HSP70 family sugar kinase n=1 Tax=Longimicrobium terrae TaxID=1639882 RepID=A0A841H7L3_9BACT|nr:putative NBD/HSP70 family sugar kinase [Longimicrobium terrae]MBB6073978.1 putative NBD/HSP70 family sugar kinase [Longimicrobium terrae]NNC28298.1 ROK family protein [Longimicrobium terrae]